MSLFRQETLLRGMKKPLAKLGNEVVGPTRPAWEAVRHVSALKKELQDVGIYTNGSSGLEKIPFLANTGRPGFTARRSLGLCTPELSQADSRASVQSRLCMFRDYVVLKGPSSGGQG